MPISFVRYYLESIYIVLRNEALLAHTTLSIFFCKWYIIAYGIVDIHFCLFYVYHSFYVDVFIASKRVIQIVNINLLCFFNLI